MIECIFCYGKGLIDGEGLLPCADCNGTGEVENQCPMGCGKDSDDPYGGPCKSCWEKVYGTTKSNTENERTSHSV